MKTNKVNYTKLAAAAAIACMLAITGCASTTPGNTQSNIDNTRSNLDPSTRANHNELLPPSFYDSNHEIPS